MVEIHVCWSVVAGQIREPDSSSGVSFQQSVGSRVVTLVFFSKTLNHHCSVLQMGSKAIGSVCCVMHVKEPSALIVKRRGLPQCSWSDRQHIAPQHRVNHYMEL